MKEHSPANNLDFRPVRPILNFWPLELQHNKFVLFEATDFVVICYKSNRKRICFPSYLIPKRGNNKIHF